MATETAPFPYERTHVLGRRVLAHVIDSIVVTIPLALVFFAIADESTGASGNGVYLTVNDKELRDGAAATFMFASFVLWVAYLTAMTAATGRTVGKLLTGIKVVGQDGGRVGAGPALTRSLLWVVDDFPYIIPGVVGFSVAAADNARRRVGDRVAKTVVVRA